MLSSFSSLWLCDPVDFSPLGSSVHGILRQEYWSELPCPSLGYLPNPKIKPRDWIHLLHHLHWQVGSLPEVPPEKHPFLLLNQWTSEVNKNPEIQGRKALGNASSPWRTVWWYCSVSESQVLWMAYMAKESFKKKKKSGYIYTYNWFILLYSRNEHIVNQLYFNKKF